MWAAIAGAGGAIGLLPGAVLTTQLSWRWVFFVNLPIAAFAALAAFPLIGESRDPVAGGFDLPGAVTGTAGWGRWSSPWCGPTCGAGDRRRLSWSWPRRPSRWPPSSSCSSLRHRAPPPPDSGDPGRRHHQLLGVCVHRGRRAPRRRGHHRRMAATAQPGRTPSRAVGCHRRGPRPSSSRRGSTSAHGGHATGGRCSEPGLCHSRDGTVRAPWMTYERNLGGQLRTSRFELAALTRANPLTDFRPAPQEKLKPMLEYAGGCPSVGRPGRCYGPCRSGPRAVLST